MRIYFRNIGFIFSRYLSAERARGRWHSAATKVNPSISRSLTNGVLSSEEEDFLQSSMASTKTVCSDAFDFLFDSQNLDPKKVLNHEALLQFTEEKFQTDPAAGGHGRGNHGGGAIIVQEGDLKKNNVVKHSACCVIS